MNLDEEFGTSLVYTRNRSGHRMDPCETPHLT